MNPSSFDDRSNHLSSTLVVELAEPCSIEGGAGRSSATRSGKVVAVTSFERADSMVASKAETV